jgi:hypothetical protein
MPMNQEQLEYQKRSARLYQEKYDGVLRQVGMQAPEPILGQSPDTYRRETLRTLKKTFLANHELNKVNMRGLDSSVLPPFEAQVLDAVVKEAHNPRNVPLGELRKIERYDEYGKVKEILFVGQRSFCADMGRPGRKVVSFLTPNGRYDPGKGKWF